MVAWREFWGSVARRFAKLGRRRAGPTVTPFDDRPFDPLSGAVPSVDDDGVVESLQPDLRQCVPPRSGGSDQRSVASDLHSPASQCISVRSVWLGDLGSSEAEEDAERRCMGELGHQCTIALVTEDSLVISDDGDGALMAGFTAAEAGFEEPHVSVFDGEWLSESGAAMGAAHH